MTNTERTGGAITAALQPRTELGTFAPGDDRRQLTERQATFVRFYAQTGGDGKRSAIAAGYAADSASVEASRLLRLPWIRAELERERGRLLAELDVKSLAVLRGVLDDLQAGTGLRLKAAEIAQKIVGADRAGRDKAKDDKDLSAMTIAELEAYIRAREEGLQRVGAAPPVEGSAPVDEPHSS